jgi:hypothetical protein
MLLRVLDSGEIEFPITTEELQQRFPRTSFADPITTSALPEGYWAVHTTEFPFELRPSPGYKLDLSNPAWDGEKWVQSWRHRPFTETELEEFKVKQKLARNRLLEATDWTQLPDVPKKTSEMYREYRQNLRDITQDPSFPFVSLPES